MIEQNLALDGKVHFSRSVVADYSYGNDYGFGDGNGDYSDSSTDTGNTLAPKDKDGNFVVDDMVLTPERYNFEFGTDGDSNGTMNVEQYRWENGVVPYEFSTKIGKVNEYMSTQERSHQ